MSSAQPQPPKSLTTTTSQSSILLSTANLSWTPTSGAALLAAPQPPEVVAPPPTVSSPVPSDHSSITGLQHPMTNEEIIRSLRLPPTSAVADTESIDSQALEESFQTISLTDGRAGTPVATGAAGGGDDLLSGEQSPIGSTVSSLSSASALNQKHQKLSFIESLATAFHKTSQVLVAGSGGGSGGSGQTGTAAAAGADGQQSMAGAIPDNYHQPMSQYVPSQSLPPPPPPLSVAAVQPPPPPPPVLSPNESVVAKDFKLRGPLRLYDPNHGISGHSGGQSLPPQLPLPPIPSYIPPATDDQSLPAPPPVPTLPFPQPSAADTLYNPNDYYDSTTAPGGQSPAPPPLDIAQSYTGQSYDSTFGAIPLPLDNSAADSSGSTTAGDYSFISQPSATVNPWETAPDPTQQQPYTAPLDQLAGTGSAQHVYQPYTPVLHHWFYQQIVENREVWRPFSLYDSYNLEQAVQCGQQDYNGAVIATDGGRFDVFVPERVRRPVYWSEADTLCRRCSWFYRREGHNRWIPYTEEVAERLEQRYRESAAGNRWNTRVELDGGQEAVVMHSPLSIYHYQLDQTMPDGWGQAVENPQRPRVVCRAGPGEGLFDDIDEGEPVQVDHLVFLIHGVGEICDFRFRSIIEVVDDFRTIALGQMRVHYRSYMESGQLGRVELLPISWHQALHGDETGIDDRLRQITLDSIPKLRHFSNDTILDALFYTSPVYCQTIVDSVAREMNRLFDLFCTRNPNFCGTVALGGHSLGSLIVFDILAHQPVDNCPPQPPTPDTAANTDSIYTQTTPPLTTRPTQTVDNNPTGGHTLGFPAINYPTLAFKPSALFAMGSPLPMFLTVRGVHCLSPDYRLPTCPAVYNIFHPYDPIAYRLEPMIYRAFKDIKPVLVPHHKGRKRMHLELRDSIARVGTDIKNRIYDGLRYTWSTINEFARAHRPLIATPGADNSDTDGAYGLDGDGSQVIDGLSEETPAAEQALSAGALNSGRRIDYVLQESPVEAFNEYLFAMAAHACYWQSEDTALLILRELYGQLGYYTDANAGQGGYPSAGTLDTFGIATSASAQSFDGLLQQQPLPSMAVPSQSPPPPGFAPGVTAGQTFDDPELQFISH